MALNFCMGKIVCETEAKRFNDSLASASDAQADQVTAWPIFQYRIDQADIFSSDRRSMT